MERKKQQLHVDYSARVICLLTLLLNFFSPVYAQDEEIPNQFEDFAVTGFSIHSTPVSWEEAVRICSMEEHNLLCYENRQEILDIFPQKDLQNLRIWLSSMSCRYSQSVEKCLYAVIEKHHNELIVKIETNCQQKLGFVCEVEEVFLNDQSKVANHLQANRRNKCPETKRRDITWPESLANATVSMKCPGPMHGYARWFCNGTTGDWGPGQPNLADCRTVALSDVLWAVEDDLKDPQDQIIDLQKTARDLRRMVGDLQTGGDLTTTIQILDRVQDIFVSQAPAMSPSKRKEVALDTSGHVINVCSQLLTKSQSWDDLVAEDRYSTATTLLTAVDETGSTLAENIDKRNHSIFTSNVLLSVVKPEKHIKYESFVGHKMSNLTLVTRANSKYLVFASYSDLRDILPLYQDVQGVYGKVMNSPVMSANISGSQHLEKAQIRLMHFNQTLTNPICVYWDVQRQKWNSDGCVVLESNNQYTVCECTHLTNFAVLMDVFCTTCNMDEEEKIVLAMITVIGCSVSIFCLSVCIVIFTFYKSLWSMQVMIHRNLCLCLLVAQAILLGGLHRTEDKIVCACLAGLMHYFFLAAFFWMFLEAFHILWLLIKVFKPKRSQSLKYYFAGYATPLVFLAVNVGFNHEGYGTVHFCWLNSEDGSIWGFIAPVIAIILFNTSTLAYALFETHRITRRKTKNPQHKGLKLWVRGAAVLMPLLGITWIVGFLYVEKNFIIFAYIFAALNSLQGFSIFIFHLILNKKVKEHVVKSLRWSYQRNSNGAPNSKSRVTKLPSNVSSPTKKRPTSNFFHNQDHTQPFNDYSSPKSPNVHVEGKEETPFLLETRNQRNIANTN